jgi:hypothetical protein
VTWIGHDLIRDALTELSDATEQQRLWTSTGPPEVSSFDEAVERLYTDSGLDLALDDDREVYGEEIDGKLRRLAALLRKIDGRRPPLEVLRDPLLLRVRRDAAEIRRAIDATSS